MRTLNYQLLIDRVDGESEITGSCEVKDGETGNLHTRYTVVGVVEDTGRLEYRNTSISIDNCNGRS